MSIDTFTELIAIEQLGGDQNTYFSKRPSWPPGGEGAAYGGHVYAGAAWAASQTVGKGMIIHAVNGHFTLPGQTDRPYVYSIDHTSEGNAYCTRTVTVRQPLEPKNTVMPWRRPPDDTIFTAEQARQELGGIIFICICSFKKDETRNYAYQIPKQPWEIYQNVLKGTKPMDHLEAPNVDAPWYHDYQREYGQSSTVHGLVMRKVDMDRWNANKTVAEKRQLAFYRLIGSIPPDEPNLYACAHLFASDRNGLFIVSNWLGFGNSVTRLGSLSHSVVFHVGAEGLRMRDVEGDSGSADSRSFPELQEEGDRPLIVNGINPREDAATDEGKPCTWFMQESWTPRGEANRGFVESRIWDARGIHIATTMQDGLVRGVDGGNRKAKTQRDIFEEGIKVKSKL